MAKYEILKIDRVDRHPNADRLTVNHIGGHVVISNLENGKPRYSAGETVVYFPVGSVLSSEEMIAYGYWDSAKNCGLLGGHDHNCVEPRKIRGTTSEGLIVPLSKLFVE